MRMDLSGPFPSDWPAGWHVAAVAETGSTNTDLLAAADAGAPGRSVLAAAHQTAGRGRLDRRWDAPPGANLLVSFLFRDNDPAGPPVVLMRRLALAALDAVAATTGRSAELKWPNDVLLDGAKLAGLLAQRGDGVTVIGLGLNVGWAPAGAALLGDATTPAAVLRELLLAFDAAAEAGPPDVHARYVARLATLGQQVRVDLPAGEPLVGRVTGVEPDGRLIVLDECAISHRVDVGDVIHLRPAGA